MTVMELNSNAGLNNETKKFSELNDQSQSQINQIINENFRKTHPPNSQHKTNRNHQSNNDYDSSSRFDGSRKNSSTGSGNIGMDGMPQVSNLSLSSTSSASSLITGSNVTNSNGVLYSSASMYKKNGQAPKSKHNSTSTPQTSRRASGNSITIRVTNENNEDRGLISSNRLDQLRGAALMEGDDKQRQYDNEEQLEANDDDENEDNLDEMEDRFRDRDEGEDSNSTSNEFNYNRSSQMGQLSRKKLKERRKLVRSSAQQRHHLINQESEDLIEPESERRNHAKSYMVADPSIELIENYPKSNMNSAFDELFAAAQTGDTTMSAIIEAKIAAATAAAAEQAEINTNNSNDLNLNENEIPFLKKNSTKRASRNASFKSKASGGTNSGGVNSEASSKKVSLSKTPNDSFSDMPKLQSGVTEILNKGLANNLRTEGYLGSPQQLTRSCSCKRPGSFKKMRARNSISASKSGAVPTGTESTQVAVISPTPSYVNASSPVAPNVTGRRGTHGSISISDELESSRQQNRACSLPFENLPMIGQQQQQQQHQQQQQQNQHHLGKYASRKSKNGAEDKETYRVRQFNITNNGSIINRGDSFKRSFKKSNQSISSSNKRDNTSSAANHDGYMLNLPQQGEFIDGFTASKSSNSSNYGISDANDVTSLSATNNDALIGLSNEFAVDLNAGLESGLKIGTEPIAEESYLNPDQDSAIKIQQTQPNNQETFLIYVMGASGVGKNALIKQFKTSEYRGTYDISFNHQSTGKF
jgi:hypothetical protein